jgi:hypothetical protein
VYPKLRQVYIDDQPVNRRSVAIDLSDIVEMKTNDIQTVQLEPGATSEKQYPAVIAGNSVNILPIKSSDTDYVEVEAMFEIY